MKQDKLYDVVLNGEKLCATGSLKIQMSKTIKLCTLSRRKTCKIIGSGEFQVGSASIN